MVLVFQYSSTGWFRFELKKIPDNVDKTRLVVGDNRGVHEEKQDQNKHFSMYRDMNMFAAFTVTDNRVDNKEGYSYYGSFRYNNHIYSLEPVYPGESRGENVFNRDYIIQIHGIKYHLKKRDDKSRGEVDNTVVGKNDSKTVNPKWKGDNKKFVGEKQILTVEVLIILDFSIYKKWMHLMNNDKAIAVENMKYYYSEIVNGIKMRYEGINLPKYMYTIALAGFYIAEDPKMVPFIEDPSIKYQNVVDHMKALKEFSNWISTSIKSKLPRFDVAALFTTYEMPGINGIAYVSGVCLNIGVSLNRDTGPFKAADTAAHEIGHNLGSQHDGDKNTCTFEDQYIMAAGRAPLNQQNYDNPFVFSPCSLNYFANRIHALNKNNQNCMEDSPSSNEPLYAEKFFNAVFGQKYSLEYQCKITVGAKSYVCSDGQRDNENICNEIGCYSPMQGSCVAMRPANRTSCGLNSWCIKGRCVNDRNAPVFKDKCILGDSTNPITMTTGRKTCKDLINRNPTLCNEESYKRLCCDICEKKENKENKNCPFGDSNTNCNQRYCHSPYYRIVCCKTCNVGPTEKLVQSRCETESITDWCQTIDSTLCYANKDLCCAGCAKYYDPSAKGCEYGDTGPWCANRVAQFRNECERKSISDPCCKSCRGVTPGKTTKPKPGRTVAPAKTIKPARTTKQPARTTKQPARTTKQPARTTKQPARTTKQPARTTKPGRTNRPGRVTKPTERCQDKEDCSHLMAWHCYTKDIRDRCCRSCKQREIIADAKCKYGDHATWCYEQLRGNLHLCDDERMDYSTTCCYTCEQYKRSG